MRTLVIGDIHGNYLGLQQVLERCKFNLENDKLIQLGDIADGWSDVSQCVDYFLNIQSEAKHEPIFIRGNHDVWLYDWLHFGRAPLIWTQQGGQATIDGYLKTAKNLSEEHRQFFKNQLDWYIDDKNRLFIHGGYSYLYGFPNGAKEPIGGDAGSLSLECHWDRSLFETTRSTHAISQRVKEGKSKLKLTGFAELEKWNEVYIGHTARKNGPENYFNLWNMDTGSGWKGRLSIMDIETKEVWYADPSPDLYPNERGR